MNKLLVAAVTIAGLAAPALAGAQELPRRLGGENGPKKAAEAARPAPKLADGTVDLSGIWTGGGDAPIPRLLKKGELDTLLLPWAKQKMASLKESDDPYFYCMPGGPLRITGGFAWRLVQPAGERSKYIFMLQEGNAHSFRQIFMDGRKHPDDPSPTWFGHSIGRWEGSTLVVDTVGLNDRFWLDSAGTPHTEQLHLVERFTRTDFNSLKYEATVDDPGAYTAVWTGGFIMRWSPGTELFEYICQDNNRSPQGMVGADASVSRQRRIVP